MYVHSAGLQLDTTGCLHRGNYNAAQTCFNAIHRTRQVRVLGATFMCLSHERHLVLTSKLKYLSWPEHALLQPFL